MRGKRWTEAEMNQLRSLCQQPLSLEQIATIVGHPVRSTANKLHELRLKKSYSMYGKCWKPEEDEVIKRVYLSESMETIQTALPKRAWPSIIRRANQLGMKRLEMTRMRETLGHAEQQLKELSEMDKAYVAGIIDGEGTLGISRYHSSRTGKPYYVTYFSIVNTSKELMNWLQEKIFVKLSLRPGALSNEGKLGKRTVYIFTMGTKKAYLLAKMALPYLIIKKRRAELLIRFAESRLSKPRKAPYGEEELEIYRQMKELIKNGL